MCLKYHKRQVILFDTVNQRRIYRLFMILNFHEEIDRYRGVFSTPRVTQVTVNLLSS